MHPAAPAVLQAIVGAAGGGTDGAVLAPAGGARPHYRELAENNRSRLVTLAAPRGALLDRKGRLLVENRPSFNVVMMPEHAENLDAR